MIIINVLPPEYRRRDIGINPITISIAGAALVNFIVVLVWLYIAFISIPAAEKERSDREAVKNRVAAEAAKVDKIEGKITAQLKVRKTLIDLLNKKVYWAKTLNDFVNVLTEPSNPLNSSGFEVSVESFEITETQKQQVRTRGKKQSDADSGRSFDFEWKALVLTDNPQAIPEHIRTFFFVFESSDFWIKHGFKNQPDKSYTGNKIEVKEEVGKAIAIFDLTWNRIVFSRNAEDVITKKLKEQADAAAKVQR